MEAVIAKAKEIPYIYQLQKASFMNLHKQDFRVAVVDMDDASMSRKQVEALQDQGKSLISYVSIGEAEDYRDYWKNNDWDSNKPDFLLDENPSWRGNFNVKFWDKEWQKIILERLDQVIENGYDGAYLDIVDGYTVTQVVENYPGSKEELREEMVDFILAISKHTKAQNPDFKIVPQNAVGLLSMEESIGLSDPLEPNARYLNAIDGVGKEDTWYDDNTKVDWTAYDLRHLENAVDAGKFVLAVDYTTEDASQSIFVKSAAKAGYIPFIGTRALDGTFDDDNFDIGNYLSARNFKSFSPSWKNEPITPFENNIKKNDNVVNHEPIIKVTPVEKPKLPDSTENSLSDDMELFLSPVFELFEGDLF